MDAYEILGVKRISTDSEIKTAYRRLCKVNHPDHGGSTEKMAELNKAYKLIATEEARAKYNAEHSFAAEFNMFANIFGRPTVARDFGKKPDMHKAINGTDINLSVNIPVSVFLHGYMNMPLKYKRDTECLECSGTGAKKFVQCSKCGGYGHSSTRKTSCKKCSGTGISITEKCPECEKGVKRKDTVLPINYQKYTETMVIKGRGNTGLFGGGNGNLNVTFVPTPEDGVSFVNGTLVVETTSVWPEDFVLGRTVDVKVCGKVCHIPLKAGIKSSEVNALYDHKIPMLVKFGISVNENTDEELELYKKLREIHQKK